MRTRRFVCLMTAAALLVFLVIAGFFCAEEALVTDFSRVDLPPSLAHLFGTDWLGRDMLLRTLRGLSISILTGVLAAAASAVIALVLGILAAQSRRADAVISYCIDMVMGIPHILLLVLISLALGKGLRGVALGIILTHWPSLTRVIRGEILQLKESPYILVAKRLGRSNLQIAYQHILPNVLPQFLTGLILLFPHAILHESSVTFLGFGLSAEQPAIGIILSESMRYLILGNWWVAVFPGILLVVTVLLFQYAGESLKRYFDPAGVHR